MDFYLDDDVIKVRKIDNTFFIEPRAYQSEFDEHLKRNPVVAGTYCPKEPDWLTVRHIIGVLMFPRQVKREEIVDADIKELENDTNVIY